MWKQRNSVSGVLFYKRYKDTDIDMDYCILSIEISPFIVWYRCRHRYEYGLLYNSHSYLEIDYGGKSKRRRTQKIIFNIRYRYGQLYNNHNNLETDSERK